MNHIEQREHLDQAKSCIQASLNPLLGYVQLCNKAAKAVIGCSNDDVEPLRNKYITLYSNSRQFSNIHFQVDNSLFHDFMMGEEVAIQDLTTGNESEITSGERTNGEGDDMLLEMVLKQSLLETTRQEDSINVNSNDRGITIDQNGTWNIADDDAVMEYVLRESAREVGESKDRNGTIPQHNGNQSSPSAPNTSETPRSSSVVETLPQEELSERHRLERVIESFSATQATSEEHLIESGRARLERLLQAYPSLSVPEAGSGSIDNAETVAQLTTAQSDCVEKLEEGNADGNDMALTMTPTAVSHGMGFQQPQSDSDMLASTDDENDAQQPQSMCPLTMTPTAINYHQTFTIVPTTTLQYNSTSSSSVSQKPPKAYRLRGSDRKGEQNVVYYSSSCCSDSVSVSTCDEYEDCFGKFKMSELDKVKVKPVGDGHGGLQRSHSNEGSNARPGAYNVAGDDIVPMVTMAPRPPSTVYSASQTIPVQNFDEPAQANDDDSDFSSFIGWKSYKITMALAIIVLLVLIAILAAISVVLF